MMSSSCGSGTWYTLNFHRANLRIRTSHQPGIWIMCMFSVSWMKSIITNWLRQFAQSRNRTLFNWARSEGGLPTLRSWDLLTAASRINDFIITAVFNLLRSPPSPPIEHRVIFVLASKAFYYIHGRRLYFMAAGKEIDFLHWITSANFPRVEPNTWLTRPRTGTKTYL